MRKSPADPSVYHVRMQRVLACIEHDLDGDLGLDRLSDVAAFSRYHFHRQFSAFFGISLHRYVQLARMKRASWQLAYRPHMSITMIGLDAGYETSDSFARAFRMRLGQAPAEFRAQPDWRAWSAAMAPLDDARMQIMTNDFSMNNVHVRDERAIPIAFMSHKGPPARLGETIRRFIAWRKANGVRPANHATFTIFHTDPDSVAPEDYHIDLATQTSRIITPADEDMQSGIIPAGRCAVLRVIGQSDNLHHAAEFLYARWLPASGETLRDFPLYAQRVVFFPDVPEADAITDLFLPLA